MLRVTKLSFPLLLTLAAYLLLPLPGRSAPLPERVEAKREQIRRAERVEGVLTQRLTSDKLRVQSLQGQLSGTEERLRTAQERLNGRRAELQRIRDRLEVIRDRLARLRERFRLANGALARRLVELYKSDQPDALTVVLEADGFDDLLERTDFLERIAEADRGIIDRVRVLKAGVEEEAKSLGQLERQAETVATGLLRRRDEIAASRDQLASTAADLIRARDRRAGALEEVRSTRTAAQEDLGALEREQAAISQRLRSTGGAQAPAPVRGGSGQLIWPLDGTITSPFGQRWGRIHEGLDIAVPEGTPIRAAASGQVALAAYTGGYGNYTCIQHDASLSTCYAHQSRLGASTGTAVSQGQVIGYSGNTGNSSGPHLHFEVRLNGSAVDPLGYL